MGESLQEQVRWWHESIERTHDDREIWDLEGALEELAFYRDHETEDERERASVQAIIASLSIRHRQLVCEVRG